MLTDEEMNERADNFSTKEAAVQTDNDENPIIQTDHSATTLSAQLTKRRYVKGQLENSTQSHISDLEDTKKENKPWFGARAWNYVKKHPVKCCLIAAVVVLSTALIATGIFVLPLLGVKLIAIAGIWGVLAKTGAIATPTLTAGAIWGGCEIVDSCRSSSESTNEYQQELTSPLIADQSGSKEQVSPGAVLRPVRTMSSATTSVPARPKTECSLLSWISHWSFWGNSSGTTSPQLTRSSSLTHTFDESNPVYRPQEDDRVTNGF